MAEDPHEQAAGAAQRPPREGEDAEPAAPPSYREEPGKGEDEHGDHPSREPPERDR